jgi:ankyrin repeat protein
MAESSPRSADASHPDAAAQGRAASRNAAAPMPRTPPADPAALRRAAEFGDIHGLQTLLDERVSIDARDAGGRTALMLAVLHGHAEAVDALLAHGADPNAADAHGTTPLEAAVAGNQPAVAAALRRAGARAH